MFVFLYPENILLPPLRRWQTPAFDSLVRELRSRRQLTPDGDDAADEQPDNTNALDRPVDHRQTLI